MAAKGWPHSRASITLSRQTAPRPQPCPNSKRMRTATYIGGLLGLILLSLIFVRVDFAGMLHTASLAGGKLLWLAPYRLLFFSLYALGWAQLLRPYDPDKCLRLGYVFWVTAVREAIDRLLPVASVGGAVVGVRLVQLRGIALVPAIATVIVEVLLTLFAIYFFTVLGVLLLIGSEEPGRSIQLLVLALLMSLPIPVIVTCAASPWVCIHAPGTIAAAHRGDQSVVRCGGFIGPSDKSLPATYIHSHFCRGAAACSVDFRIPRNLVRIAGRRTPGGHQICNNHGEPDAGNASPGLLRTSRRWCSRSGAYYDRPRARRRRRFGPDGVARQTAA
jgi:hypothetical protein